MRPIVRLCDIIDIKNAFMEKTDLSEEEIQTIIDGIPTAYDIDELEQQIKNLKPITVDIGYGTIVSTLSKDVVLNVIKDTKRRK